MDQKKILAEQFEANRAHLRSVAYRLLGSTDEADDAVQETWLRLTRSDTSAVDNFGGWLTTVVARVCLDMLRSRKSRREDPLEDPSSDDEAPALPDDAADDPEKEMILADSVELALLVILERLNPAERIAFVLHDMFDVSFDEIAPIVGKSSTATRQLASRARRRVQGVGASAEPERRSHREIVDAFLAAAREGDLTALVALLAPDVVLRADFAALQMNAARAAHGAPKLEPEVRGAETVTKTFSGGARVLQPALIDGVPGLVWMQGGVPRVVFMFGISDGKVAEIGLIADQERIGGMEVSLVEDH